LLECVGSSPGGPGSDSQCRFYRGGDRSFELAFGFEISSPVSGVALADVLGDEHAEVVLASGSTSGNPGFVSAWDSPTSGETLDFPGAALFDLLPEAQDPLPSASGGESWIYPGDWNRDGRTDFVCSVLEPSEEGLMISLTFARQEENGEFTLEFIRGGLSHSMGQGTTFRPDFIGVPALP
jgi:hypothetical protein